VTLGGFGGRRGRGKRTDERATGQNEGTEVAEYSVSQVRTTYFKVRGPSMREGEKRMRVRRNANQGRVGYCHGKGRTKKRDR